MRASILVVAVGLALCGCAHAPQGAERAERDGSRRLDAPRAVPPQAPPLKKPARAGIMSP